MWRCGGSNPGPFTCKANALPLSYIPLVIVIVILILSVVELAVDPVQVLSVQNRRKKN